MEGSTSGRLADVVAIVTGSGHGIGRALAHGLSSHGASLAVADLDGEATQKVTQEIIDMGGAAVGRQTDVGAAESVEAMAQTAVREFGRIDVLVNSAAIITTIPVSRGAFDEIDPQEWDRVMHVNVKGTWLACRAVAPHMRRQKYGKIINVSSGTALKGTAGRIHYVASKAAILGLTRTLAMELGKDNICVNTIAPGSTLSEEDPSPEVVAHREKAAKSRALARVQTPHDLVGAVVFLASHDSDFITGQTLVVDGGSIMH
jgi:3-oxoacyl-[acyl-carrier protein] reductase